MNSRQLVYKLKTVLSVDLITEMLDFGAFVYHATSPHKVASLPYRTQQQNEERLIAILCFFKYLLGTDSCIKRWQ